MLSHRDRERLDKYFPEKTFWMRFHLVFWLCLTVAASCLVLLFILLGKASASIPGLVILAFALFGVGAIPVYVYFLQLKKRREFREKVVSVGSQVIYRIEGYDTRRQTILLNDLIRPMTRKSLLPLVAGMLSPAIGQPPRVPDWVSITFYATPYVETTWNNKKVKARGFCEDHKHILLAAVDTIEMLQSLLLHETAHAILVESFPGMPGAEQERIIKESQIEKTDLLGLG